MYEAFGLLVVSRSDARYIYRVRSGTQTDASVRGRAP